MKKAILQVADTGPLESLVVMLKSAGYQCYLPNNALRRALTDLGCDTVIDVDHLVSSMGYERPVALPEAGPDAITRISDGTHPGIYVDVKAHRNLPRVCERWPGLKNKTLWYRINGGMPEHVVNARGDHGDEVNPPCPVLTPNQWYGSPPPDEHWVSKGAYVCWPPFYRFGDYHDKLGRKADNYAPPVCLIHNLTGWGYGRLVEPLRSLGVCCYGAGSPDGLVEHARVPIMLSVARAMVHMKSSDAPGYALYEAMAAACPVVCTRRLIWRCRMQDLLIPGETCLVFDRETHDGLTDEDVVDCTEEVRDHLADLRDPGYNRKIGEAGHRRLKEIMWREDRDGFRFGEWCSRTFG